MKRVFVPFVVLAIMALSARANNEAGNPVVRKMRHAVVFKQKGVYAAWPVLFPQPNGRVVVVFRSHASANHLDYRGGAKWIAVDPDDPSNWSEISEPEVVNPDLLKPGGTQAGAWSLGWVQAPIAEKETLKAQHKVVRDLNETTVSYLGEARCRFSKDDGKTWEFKEIPLPAEFAGSMGYTRTATLTKPNGLHLVAFYGRRWRDGHPTFGVEGYESMEELFLRSTDHGKTWSIVEQVPGGLDTKKHPSGGLNETALVENSRGEIVALSRAQGDGHLNFASFSSDDGLTWSEPVDSGIRGNAPHLLKLRDGRILCTYGFRRWRSEPTVGVFALISEDGGHTWPSRDHQITLRDDGWYEDGVVPGDTGYPQSIQLADGSVFTVYYITTEEGITHIAATRWELPPGKTAGWENLSPMPQPLGGGAGVMMPGGSAIIGGSYWGEKEKKFSDAIYRFNGTTQVWDTLPSFPVAAAYGSGVRQSDGSFLYLGGFQGTRSKAEASRQCWKFSGAWKKDAPLPLPLVFHEAATVGNEVFVIGGTTDPEDLNAGAQSKVWRKKPDESNWRAGRALPDGGRMLFASAAFKNSIYVFCGLTGVDKKKGVLNTATALRYDVVKDRWEKLPDAPVAARGCKAVALPGKGILLMGGYGKRTDVAGAEDGFLKECWLYDVGTKTYVLYAELPEAVMTQAVAVEGRKVWSFGGEDKPGQRSLQACVLFVGE